MRMSRNFLISIVTLFLTSCRTGIPDHTGPDVDMRQGSDHCELHNRQMRAARVPAAIGSVLPSPGYLEARRKLFPHSFPQVRQSRKRFCIIAVCDECIA